MNWGKNLSFRSKSVTILPDCLDPLSLVRFNDLAELSHKSVDTPARNANIVAPNLGHDSLPAEGSAALFEEK